MMNTKEFILKKLENWNIDDLKKLVSAAEANAKHMTKQEYVHDITSMLLHDLNAPTGNLGYDYLRSAIEYLLLSGDPHPSMTQVLYPTVAKKHASTASRVERAIRHEIECIYDRSTLETQKMIQSIASADPQKGKATNTEFIYGMADHIQCRYLTGMTFDSDKED